MTFESLCSAKPLSLPPPSSPLPLPPPPSTPFPPTRPSQCLSFNNCRQTAIQVYKKTNALEFAICHYHFLSLFHDQSLLLPHYSFVSLPHYHLSVTHYHFLLLNQCHSLSLPQGHFLLALYCKSVTIPLSLFVRMSLSHFQFKSLPHCFSCNYLLLVCQCNFLSLRIFLLLIHYHFLSPYSGTTLLSICVITSLSFSVTNS